MQTVVELEIDLRNIAEQLAEEYPDALEAEQIKIEDSYNGSTQDFDSYSVGSTPTSSAI